MCVAFNTLKSLLVINVFIELSVVAFRPGQVGSELTIGRENRQCGRSGLKLQGSLQNTLDASHMA